MSVAYWKRPTTSQFFVAEPADPGLTTLYHTQGRTALYHSPFLGTWRLTEQILERHDWGEGNNWGAKISAEQAQEEYGLGGLLQFDRDITPGEARLMMERKQDELNREYIISTGSTTFGRKVGGFAVSLGATALDPINLASMFVPIVGQSNFARLVGMTGGSLWKARLLKGVIEGAVGAAMVEPFVLLPAMQEQANYGLKDSAINLGFGAILGGALQAGIGAAFDFAKGARARKNPLITGLFDAEAQIKRLPQGDQDQMMRTALSQFLQDEPVNGPAELMQLSDAHVRAEVSFDAVQARKQAMAELGFDTAQPDTFKLYPDKSIADPKPNEPWFHGRPQETITFDKGRRAWFARDPDVAAEFGLPREQVGEYGNVFVTNLEVKKTASVSDLKPILDELNLKYDPDDSIQISGFIEFDRVVDSLKARGFDSFLGLTDIPGKHGVDTMVIFDPDVIQTPGRRPRKTATGIEYRDGKEQLRTLEQRTKDLQQSKVKNLIERKRREFKKTIAQRKIDPVRIDDAHAFDNIGPERELATIEDDIRRLEDTFKVDDLTPEERAFVDDELRDFGNHDNDQTAVRTAIECLIRNA